MVRIAAALDDGQRGSGADWTVLNASAAQPILLVPIAAGERKRLLDFANVWLAVAGVRPLLSFEKRRLIMTFVGGLFGAIAMQLAAAIGHT
jgi:hypothetical protein